MSNIHQFGPEWISQIHAEIEAWAQRLDASVSDVEVEFSTRGHRDGGDSADVCPHATATFICEGYTLTAKLGYHKYPAGVIVPNRFYVQMTLPDWTFMPANTLAQFGQAMNAYESMQ